jgi:aspartate aminotransferase
MKEQFLKRRDLGIKQLLTINNIVVNIPHGAFYLFPYLKDYLGRTFENYTIHSMTDLSNFILDYAHVATVPGDAFGDPHCIRLSFATSEDILVEGIQRMKKALDNFDTFDIPDFTDTTDTDTTD